ncbi:MAG TPA: hypothetical protein VFQ44_17245 [Streptosporangiaceae bacterium]|nr:hypothetical protein [Streptosporangiaceae bacterium]
MPPGTPITTFDDLYAHVVVLVDDARLVDEEMDQVLSRSWGEFFRGSHELYGLSMAGLCGAADSDVSERDSQSAPGPLS